MSDYVSDLGNNNLQHKLLQREQVQGQKLLEKEDMFDKMCQITFVISIFNCDFILHYVFLRANI